MKRKIGTPILGMAIAGFTLFSCASSDESRDSTTMDTPETGTVEEPVVAAPETEPLSNESVAYEEMFEDVSNTEQYDALTLIKMNPNFSTFVDLLERSGLDASLQASDSEITIFAPTNEAFQQMDQEEYERLTDPNNSVELMKIMRAHILPSKVYFGDFNTTQVIETGTESDIPVTTRMNGEVVYVGGAEIVKPDVATANGIVHVVNGVMNPSDFEGGMMDDN